MVIKYTSLLSKLSPILLSVITSNSNVRTPNKLTLVKSKADVHTYHKHRAEASGEGNLVPGTVWVSSDLRTVGSLEKTEGCVQKGEQRLVEGVHPEVPEKL